MDVSDILKLKAEDVANKAAIDNADRTSSGSVSKFMTTVKQVTTALEDVIVLTEEVLSVVEDFSASTQSIGNTLLEAISDPLSIGADITSSYSEAPTIKSNPQKECGLLSLVGSGASAVKEVLSSFRETVASIPSNVFSMTAEHCIALGVSTLRLTLTKQQTLIDSILSDCDSIYNTLLYMNRPYTQGVRQNVVSELVGLVQRSQVSLNKVSQDFLGHRIFNTSEWTASYEALDEAAQYLMDNLGGSSDESLSYLMSTDTVVGLKLKINKIAMNACLLYSSVGDIQLVSSNLNHTSTTPVVTPLEVGLLACVDRASCHLDYVLSILENMSHRGIIEADARSLDVYTHLRQISIVMSNMSSFLGNLAPDRPTLAVNVSSEDTDMLVESTMSFRETLELFLQEALSLTYSKASLRRINLLLTKLKTLSYTVSSSFDVFDTCLLDPENKYADILQEAVSGVSLAYEYGMANYATWKAYLDKGSFSEAFNCFLNDVMISQLEKLLTSTNLSDDVRSQIQGIIDRRRTSNRARGIGEHFKAQSLKLCKDALSKKKRQMIQDLKLYQQVSGFLQGMAEVAENVAQVSANVSSAFNTVYNVLSASNKAMFNVSCGKVL